MASLPNAEHPAAPVAESWGLTHTEIVKVSYSWTINNFSFCGAKTGDTLKSPPFSTGANDKLNWHLKAYPKGDIEENKDHLSVYLGLVSRNGDGVTAKFKMFILNTNREESNTKESGIRRFNQECEWLGYNKFIRRDYLLDAAHEFLTDDRLTLCCEISLVADSFNVSGGNNFQSFKIPDCALPGDMDQLFESQRFSDFILSVNGEELFVHKCILASRSPVFAAMFDNEMEEKKENRVEITDVNVEVMKEMLRFVYTGQVPSVEEMAQDLFVVADKYALDRLKMICEKTLCANLSVDNASNVLVLADLHHADQLKARVIDFIILHATEVMATSDWETKVMQHLHLVAAVLQALASKQPHLEPPKKISKLF